VPVQLVPLRMNRRQLLRTGLGGAAVLAAAGAGYGLVTREPSAASDDGHHFTVLDGTQQTIVAAIAPVMLAGALPQSAAAHKTALRDVVRGVDTAVAALPPLVQDEVRQLFSLLGFPASRWLVAGIFSSWTAAKPADIDGFLTRWRYSPFPLLRSGYQALHQLVFGAWYANPISWARIGYPGPPEVN
jgi:hypothetical protein